MFCLGQADSDAGVSHSEFRDEGRDLDRVKLIPANAGSFVVNATMADGWGCCPSSLGREAQMSKRSGCMTNSNGIAQTMRARGLGWRCWRGGVLMAAISLCMGLTQATAAWPEQGPTEAVKGTVSELLYILKELRDPIRSPEYSTIRFASASRSNCTKSPTYSCRAGSFS